MPCIYTTAVSIMDRGKSKFEATLTKHLVIFPVAIVVKGNINAKLPGARG